MAESTDTPSGHSPDRARVEASEISFALRDLSVSLRLHERHLAHQMRLKPSEYQAMEQILEADGTLGPLDLAARLGLAPGTTSELLDRLQQLGHVVRDRDARDRRRVKLAATPAATAGVVAAIGPAIKDLDAVAASLDPAEREVVLRFLRDASLVLRSHASTA